MSNNKDVQNKTVAPIHLINMKGKNLSAASSSSMNDLDNEWEIKNNKNQNKRNISTSSSASMKSPTLPKNKKPKKPLFITTNRFEVLSQNDDEVFATTPYLTKLFRTN